MTRLFARDRFTFGTILVLLLCAFLPACSGKKQGATSQGFFASGRANINISVTGRQSLTANGTRTVGVPSDNMLPVNAKLDYAVFTEEEDGPIKRHTHILLGELSRSGWRWEMETWGLPETISYDKMRKSGKDWTEQIFPVAASADWFSSLYTANGREVPEFWLAKRWSATPETHIRVVIEYREPAPVCIVPTLETLYAQEKGVNKSNARRIWKNCTETIFEFSARADNAVLLEKFEHIPGPALQIMKAVPQQQLDIGKALGRAQKMDRNSPGRLRE